MDRQELAKHIDVDKLDSELELLAIDIMMKRSEIWGRCVKLVPDEIPGDKVAYMSEMSRYVTAILVEKIRKENEEAVEFAAKMFKEALGI